MGGRGRGPVRTGTSSADPSPVADPALSSTKLSQHKARPRDYAMLHDPALRDETLAAHVLTHPTGGEAKKVASLPDLLQRYRADIAFFGGSIRAEELGALWQAVAFRALDKVAQILDGKIKHTAHALQVFTNVAGIATEKTLLVAGRPTSIVAEIHEMNLNIPDLAEKLARVAQRLKAS